VILELGTASAAVFGIDILLSRYVDAFILAWSVAVGWDILEVPYNVEDTERSLEPNRRRN
jgi:hypothetical protein